MPRAEVGSVKHLSNKMKAKGLQRLRWYCQVCQRQMRDENGFKQHTMSEAHVRQMLLVGEDPKKHIENYSRQFKHDFLQLLRVSHGEKKINLNRFYNEYIANKEHIHMNATKWPSLTEFGKYLGREGICRVEEGERGLEISWIDDSPEALRRQDAVRKKERLEKGDEEREQRQIQEQVERARQEAEAKAREEVPDEARELQRRDGEKITLNLFGKAASKPASPQAESMEGGQATESKAETDVNDGSNGTDAANEAATSAPPVKLSFGQGTSKKKDVFSSMKKNPLAAKKIQVKEPPKKMSEAERIMREEIERKRLRDERGGAREPKRQRTS